jgi:hypothetical protein
LGGLSGVRSWEISKLAYHTAVFTCFDRIALAGPPHFVVPSAKGKTLKNRTLWSVSVTVAFSFLRQEMAGIT